MSSEVDPAEIQNKEEEDLFDNNFDNTIPNVVENIHPDDVDNNIVQGDNQNNKDCDEITQNESTTCRKRRKKTSKVWDEFREVNLPNGEKKVECIHCKKKLAIGSTGATTQFKRHLDRCIPRLRTFKNQKILHFQPQVGESSESQSIQDGGSLGVFKYDHEKVREMIAHYILVNEKPFSVVEEFGFNLVLKSMNPLHMKYSRGTARRDVMMVYEKEKKKLKNILKAINKVSFTTDLWKSKNQRISYMVVTAHYVDSNWRLQKRILSFSHLPPPHSASEIVDCFFRTLTDWGIENKVFTISVDNASNNDRAIKLLKDSFRVKKKLFFGGRLFHVRCVAHILNLLVKDGIKCIDYVVEKIRDSVSFINASEARLIKFGDIVQQLQIPTKKLVMDCPTRWNSTYSMLTVAVQLKDAFFCYSDRETAYVNCPTDEEWSKIEKVCDVLGFFNEATNIISGTEYPTANLFLSQICTIKKVLDDGAISEDQFIVDMTKKMKEKFDKYWGECNLLMAFGAVMDPRMKFMVIDFAYPKIYGESESLLNISLVRSLLYEIFDEYATTYDSQGDEGTNKLSSVDNLNTSIASTSKTSVEKKYSGWHDFTAFVTSKTFIKPVKSDLDRYLEDGLEICPEKSQFDVISWWKNNQSKYRILSRMAVDILAIPISTVASESTFSAGERIVDTYRSKLSIEAVQALICGSNWIRCLYGLKGRTKEEEYDEEVEIPLPMNS